MKCATGIPRGWRLAGRAGPALAALLLAALGWHWRCDRTRVWETPRLGPPLVLLSEGPRAPGTALWLVAVNPACAHCLRVLERLAARSHAGTRVGALVVDTVRRPDPAAFRALCDGPLWWDAVGDWRRRWGHRIYGEVLCFDVGGRYLGTRPAE